jgi:hypothetical protein
MSERLRFFLATATLAVLIGPGATIASATIGPPVATVEPAPQPAVVPWKAVAASGPVEAWPAGEPIESWDRVRRGDDLEPRSAVRTGRRGHATLIQNASILMLDPESRVSLPLQGVATENNSVVQEYGAVVYEIDGRTHSGFRVVTPHLVAGVKGTVFVVTVTETHAAVTVREGMVEVTSQRTGELREVRAGETMLVDSEETDDMELVSRHARRAETKGRTNREVVRLARAGDRAIDRAMNRLGDDLAAYRFAGQRAGLGGDELERFLSGELDRTGLSGGLAEVNVNKIGIDDAEGSADDLIEDISNEELQKGTRQDDPATVPNQRQP